MNDSTSGNNSDNNKTIVSLEKINFSFSKKGPQILTDINLEIKKNDFLAIIGPNGGGKTTLLKIILGLLSPDSGSINYHGLTDKKKNKIGYVPQFSHFDKDFPINVLDLVLMGRLNEKKGFIKHYNSLDREISLNSLEKLGIKDLANNSINELSGGQLQRVLIAQALTSDPEIMLMDEPSASIDKSSEEKLTDLLKELNKSIPIVIVTHDTTSIAPFVKQIACVNKKLHYHSDGVISEETVNEIYNCPVELIAHGVPHRVLGKHHH